VLVRAILTELIPRLLLNTVLWSAAASFAIWVIFAMARRREEVGSARTLKGYAQGNRCFVESGRTQPSSEIKNPKSL
jgi:hypothetical protein